ncbi:MAG: TonB-dependent receptor domain-containing protein [Phenylobacterium sp.]
MRTGLISLAVAAALPSLAVAQEAAPAKPAPAPGKTVGEVVVTGQAQAPVQVSIDRKSYDVSKDLQAQSGAIGDALRNVPSVQVDPQGNVSLRGDSNVTILIDGKPASQFEGDNRALALQSMPASSIERVEVVTNPSAEFRADGSAGIINLITRKTRGTGVTGAVNLMAADGDRIAAGLSGGYNSKRLSMTGEVAIRQDTQNQKSVDDRLTPDPRGGFDALDQGQLANIIINSFNARGALDFDLTPRTRVGVETHGNYTFFRPNNFTTTVSDGPSGALTDSFLRRLTVHQKRAQGEVSVNLRQKLGSEGDFALSLSHEEIVDPRVRTGHAFDEVPAVPDIFDQQRLDNHLHRTELKGDLTQPFADMSKLKLGFDVQHDDNSYRNRGFDGLALTPDTALTNLFEFRQTIGAAYATYERPIGDLTVLAGLRVEDVRIHLDQVTVGQTDENDYLRAYPSLHLDWNLSDAQDVSANYSHRVQRPDPGAFNAFRLLVDPLNFRSGNPDLKPQQTQSFELGYAYRQAPVLLLATLFYRENRDGFGDVLTDLGGGIFLTQQQNLATSRSAGLEVTLNGKITPTISYGLTGGVSWSQLDSLGPTFAPTRELVAVGGQGSLSWTASAKDLFQLNAFYNPERLTSQGQVRPLMAIDLGWRHRLSDRLAVVVTARDVADSFFIRQSADTPVLIERSKVAIDNRSLRVSLSYSFGGGRLKDPGFDFQNSNGAGAGPTP